MAILRQWDIQWDGNWWISLGFHIDHTDPSLTLHLPGLIICMGRCKHPGFKHSLWRLRYTGETRYLPKEEFATEFQIGRLGGVAFANWSMHCPPIRVTPKGTQYVRAADVFSSAAGQRELKRLRDADLTNMGNQE